MNVKKILILIIVLILPFLWLIKKNFIVEPASSDIITIGILQTASHPALDRARDGFIEQMEYELPHRVKFLMHNAEGIISQAQSIAASFHGNSKVNAIYAIGTPAALAIANIERSKPIIIAAVTDPFQAGLIKSDGNVAGVSDKIDAVEQISTITKFFPRAKIIAVIHNPGEANSVAAEEMIAAIKSAKLEYISFGVSQTSDVIPATETASRKADVLLVPADNLIVSAMPSVAGIALKNKKPLFVSDPPSVERAALACLGVDYKISGKDAAQLAVQILIDGKKPADLSIVYKEHPPLYVNMHTMEVLKIEIPDQLKSRVVEVL